MASHCEIATTCGQEMQQQQRQVRDSDYYENLDLLQTNNGEAMEMCGGNNGAGPDTSCAPRTTKVDEEFNTRRHFIEYSNSGKKMNILLGLTVGLCLFSCLILASLYGHVVPSVDQVAEVTKDAFTR